MNLKNKKVLITGASGGIGNSLVEKFDSLGAEIIATGTNEEKLKKLRSLKRLRQFQDHLMEFCLLETF